VRLDFLDPGGPATGALLPTGRPLDDLTTPLGTFAVSMVDAGNACVFVAAAELGLTGVDTPEQLESNTRALEAIAAIRMHASVAMGLTESIEAAHHRPMTPFIAVLGTPQCFVASDAREISHGEYDLAARFISNGQPHRAIPGTGVLCLAVAARIPGTIAASLTTAAPGADMRAGTPAGVVQVNAAVEATDAGWRAVSATSYRTFRRLFTGSVFV
jgi:hypothetical protein